MKQYKPGQKTKYTFEGKPLYFIAYSRMTWNGRPLLLCHTNPNARPEQCGQYAPEDMNPDEMRAEKIRQAAANK